MTETAKRPAAEPEFNTSMHVLAETSASAAVELDMIIRKFGIDGALTNDKQWICALFDLVSMFAKLIRNNSGLVMAPVVFASAIQQTWPQHQPQTIEDVGPLTQEVANKIQSVVESTADERTLAELRTFCVNLSYTAERHRN